MLYLLCSGSGVAQQLTAVSPFYHALNYNSHHFRTNCQSTTCCSFRRVPISANVEIPTGELGTSIVFFSVRRCYDRWDPRVQLSHSVGLWCAGRDLNPEPVDSEEVFDGCVLSVWSM